jgi:hypothetical protein
MICSARWGRSLLFSCPSQANRAHSMPFSHRLTYRSQDLPTRPIQACNMITSCDRKPSLMSGSIDDLALINNSAAPALSAHTWGWPSTQPLRQRYTLCFLKHRAHQRHEARFGRSSQRLFRFVKPFVFRVFRCLRGEVCFTCLLCNYACCQRQ